MKFSKVASLCKARKSITIYNAPSGEQWIGVGGSAYRMSGMPTIDENTALVMLDVPAEKRNAWHCVVVDLPTSIDFSDYADDEKNIEREPINIQWYGNEYAFFPDGDVIHAIKMELLMPVLGEDEEYLTFHKRETQSGQFALAVKIAMELKAIVMPFNLNRTDEAGLNEGGNEFFRSLQTIARLYRDMPAAGFEKSERDRRAAERDGDQYEIDKETGKIINE